jgi:Putative Flp pilus-assembly TadE/G-like
MLGLAVDLGHLYIAKTELQGYADAASVAGAYALDGTSTGLTKATTAAQGGLGTPANSWNFASQAVTSPLVTFASNFAGPFQSSPVSAAGIVYVRVSVSQSLTLYFLPILPSVTNAQSISASAIAGQLARTALGDGLSPFSPDAHNAADPNFGFTVGTDYTLKWPPLGKTTSCSGDAGLTAAGGSSNRGFMDVGQGTGNSALDAVIVNNDFFLASPLAIGSPVNMFTGNGNIPASVQTRFNQDTDTTAAAFSSYAGNGRRILIVPVNDAQATPHVAGFAAFFLRPSPCGSGNASSCCAQYIGSGVEFSNHQGGGVGGGLYQVSLLQ